MNNQLIQKANREAKRLKVAIEKHGEKGKNKSGGKIKRSLKLFDSEVE